MRFARAVAVLLLLCACSCCPDSGRPPEPMTQDFPLQKGMSWIYQGTAKWTRGGSGEIVESGMTWKMEIMEVIEREHVFAAVVKGGPWDLAWYEEGKEPGDHLIVRVGPGKFFLLEGDDAVKALGTLRREGDLLGELVRQSDLFLDLPLTPGKVFGEAEQITRRDRSYCWVVEEEKGVALRDVAGVPSSGRFREYRLQYQSRPDHTIAHFVPGVGITRFQYVHHGTVSECDVRLIEYRKGSE
jgi:hypothetical protein